MDIWIRKKYEDPIYKAIPFILLFKMVLPTEYSLTILSSRILILGARGETWQVSGLMGRMNYYFINGPKLLDVVRGITD